MCLWLELYDRLFRRIVEITRGKKVNWRRVRRGAGCRETSPISRADMLGPVTVGTFSSDNTSCVRVVEYVTVGSSFPVQETSSQLPHNCGIIAFVLASARIQFLTPSQTTNILSVTIESIAPCGKTAWSNDHASNQPPHNVSFRFIQPSFSIELECHSQRARPNRGNQDDGRGR